MQHGEQQSLQNSESGAGDCAPARLSSKLKKRAAQRKQTAQALVLEYVTSAIANDDAITAAIEEGVAAVRAGDVSDFEEFAQELRREMGRDVASR